jgi:putative oxidoreductase
MRLQFHPLLLLTLRCLVGGAFIYAGALKVRDPDSFAAAIATFQLLPLASISLVSLALPIFEILVGSLLITGWQVRAGALAAFLLGTVFAIGLGQALIRGLDVNCGCFGPEPESKWQTPLALVRDFLLMGAAAVIYRSAGSLSKAPSE